MFDIPLKKRDYPFVMYEIRLNLRLYSSIFLYFSYITDKM